MRYFFHIGYLGTNYKGWQKHPDGISVQQILEKALSQIIKTPVYITGCGRTDAGVHACQYIFHTDIARPIDFDLPFRLSNVLPNDITVFDMIPMDGQPHARFDATERSYDYFIHTYKDPFLSNFSSYYDVKHLDLQEMQRAADLLLKYEDYRAFCKMPARNDNTICRISRAQLFADASGDRLRFHISANRFLGRMVRILTGKLIEIGIGKLVIDQFEAHLLNPMLSQLIKPAYPQGLYLSKIKYPYLELPVRSDFFRQITGEMKSLPSQATDHQN